MELANIEKLIEKYENATTTLQEEATLKSYFQKGNVPPHLQEYAILFGYFSNAKDEVYTKPILLKPQRNLKINMYKWSVAASIAILLSVFVGHNQYQKYQAEKKFAQLTEGLKLLSSNYKKGEEAVSNLYAYEQTVQKVIK